MRKLVTQFLLCGGSILFLPISILWWLGQLARHFHCLRRFDVAIVDPHMVHYGNGLLTQDIARRLFPGRKVIYALVWEPFSTQNVKVSLIWPDLDVILMRKAAISFSAVGRYFSFPSIEMLTPSLTWVTSVFFSIFAPKVDLMTMGEVRSSLPVPPDFAGLISENYGDTKWQGIHFHVLWTAMLKSDQQISKPALPERERKEIYARLRGVSKGHKLRLCMLYNRIVENTERSGSPIENYLPVMRLLVDHGYMVLLIADQDLDEDQMASFNGLVVDAERLGVDRDLFRMFAPTEADINIGDAGAGMLLPMIMGGPSLTLNFHSIGITTPSTWVYPKHIVDHSGAYIPYRRVIKENPYGSYLDPERKKHDDWIILTNTSEDILEAVRYFLKYLSGDEFPGISDELDALVPQVSSFKSFGARISPAFIRRDSMFGSRENPAFDFVDTNSP